MQLLLQTIIVIALFAVSQTAFSQEAHVHGVVTLSLAAEGHELLLELESPAANLLGFEHKPKTEKQQAAVKQLLNQLERPENMWKLTGAACTLSAVDIESDLLVASKEALHKGHDPHDEKHQHHKEKKHNHADKHKHHDDHKHHSDHNGHAHHNKEQANDDHAEHNDIHVSYVYHCKSLTKLTGFKTQLFGKYPSIEKIDLQWLIAHNKRKPQGAATLTQQKSATAF